MKSEENGLATEVGVPRCIYKIRLLVGDMDRSLKFYSEFLGIRVAWVEKEDEARVQVTALEVNEMEIVLIGPESGQSLAPDAQSGKGIALYMEVENISAWFKRAQQFGYTPLSPTTLKPVQRPVKRPGGETSFALSDPDGYDVRLSLLW